MELISREDLLKYVDADDIYTPDEMWKPAREWVEIIRAMPTIESRPKGKWIIKRGWEEVIVICSNCGAKDYIPTTIDGRFYFNRKYCWDCGAEMESGE